jgi:hypothetical protein
MSRLFREIKDSSSRLARRINKIETLIAHNYFGRQRAVMLAAPNQAF